MSYFESFLDKYLLRVILYTPVSKTNAIAHDAWGNEIPSYTIAEIHCYMKDKHGKGDRSDNRIGGAGLNSVYLEGYLVNPMSFPVGVVPPFECRAQIFDLNGNTKEGTFHANPRIPQPYEQPYTGERIAGTLIFGS